MMRCVCGVQFDSWKPDEGYDHPRTSMQPPLTEPRCCRQSSARFWKPLLLPKRELHAQSICDFFCAPLKSD
jgi:hypothetical protein